VTRQGEAVDDELLLGVHMSACENLAAAAAVLAVASVKDAAGRQRDVDEGTEHSYVGEVVAVRHACPMEHHFETLPHAAVAEEAADAEGVGHFPMIHVACDAVPVQKPMMESSMDFGQSALHRNVVVALLHR
jgi:hypothetical protein